MNQDLTIRFDRFLKKEMTPEELESFEHELAQNDEMRSEFEDYSLTVEAVQAHGESELRKNLDNIHDELYQPDSVKRKIGLRLLYAAAVVLAIIATGVLVTIMEPQDSLSLYAQYYEPYPVSNDRGVEATNRWDKFVSFYNSGEIEKSLIVLNEVEVHEEKPTYLVRFYQGIALLSLEGGDPLAAAKCFDEVLESDNDFHSQALWFKSMAALKSENPESARASLTELHERGDFKTWEAEKILFELSE